MASTSTSFLLSNLHCPSCVSHIQDILYALRPRPESVSPSLVSSWVTVQHDPSLARSTVKQALTDAGFDVSDVTFEGTSSGSYIEYDNGGILDRMMGSFKSGEAERERRAREAREARHVENCETCRLETGLPVFRDAPEAPSTMKQQPLISIDTGGDSNPADIWRASLAVGGMTCASCVKTVAEELRKKPWVQDVVVNLISNSATVDYLGEEHKDLIVETIEDIGYDATLDSVINLQSLHNAHERKLQRTVDILIEGMYCAHCPPRVVSALRVFKDRITLEKAPTLRDPIMRITYTPDAPSFTIRHIIKIISADDALEASIYHPPTLEERSRQIHAHEQHRILTRVIFTLIMSLPSLVIGIIFMSLVSPSSPSRQRLMVPWRGVGLAQWILFLLATPVYFLCADVFHVRAMKEFRSLWRPGSTVPLLQRFYRFGSMNMLMSLGTSIAYVSSVAQLIASAISSSQVDYKDYIADDSSFYFDSVVFLTLFLLVGRLIESYSKSKTGDAVTLLGKLRPTEAILIDTTVSANPDLLTGEMGTRGEVFVPVKVDLLEFGDNVRVLHGASPPCDGIVISGESRFDESSLTGEAKLVKKSVDDQLFSGTVNKGQSVAMKITGAAGSSMLDQIVKAVREGQTRRAPMERIADTLTSYFVPFVTLVAILTWITWLTLGYAGVLPKSYLCPSSDSDGSPCSDSWGAWSLQFAIAVFVVACPCGLALAAPTALFVGGGLAAKYGILAKGGGEAFEKASRLDVVVFDKTGTLTAGGEPSVTDYVNLIPENRHSIEAGRTILGMAKALEGHSSHTVAKAIISYCNDQTACDVTAEQVEEIPGGGIKGVFRLKDVLLPGLTRDAEETHFMIGNEKLMEQHGLNVSEFSSALDNWKSQGKSVALAAINFTAAGPRPEDAPWTLATMFAISDPIRPEAPGLIKALIARGTQVWMLSGDNIITATAVGRSVGIPATNIIAGVLPSEKADKIQYLRRTLYHRYRRWGRVYDDISKPAVIAMVGDGINDSPALTTADVGIAIGSGSDIAISSAEFVLVTSNLTALLTLLDLAQTIFRRIKFNFAWALIYNLVALPVAAGVLYPIVAGGHHVRLDPVWASLAMAMSSISVVLSSLALRSRWVGFKARELVGSE